MLERKSAGAPPANGGPDPQPDNVRYLALTGLGALASSIRHLLRAGAITSTSQCSRQQSQPGLDDGCHSAMAELCLEGQSGAAAMEAGQATERVAAVGKHTWVAVHPTA
jgi:hypothetical protein